MLGFLKAFFDPYTYQPAMSAYFMGGPMPATLQQVASANPQLAQHITSVWQFSTWLNQYFPDFYNVITNTRPDLLDAGAVVTSGKLSSATPIKSKTAPAPATGMAGLGQTEPDVAPQDYPVYDVTVGDTSSTSSTSAITEWGKMLTDLAKQYLAVDAQKKLIDLNISRAEQGLPPVDANTVAAGVNVGLSPATQNLATLAIGGLILVGLLAAFKKTR